MKKYIYLIAFTVITINTYSQNVLFEQNVLADTVKSKAGPNLKNYVHFYFGYGIMVGPSDGDGAEISTGASSNFELGVRYKYKISNLYSFGLNLSYNFYSYRIKQESDKIFPDTIIHDKEKFMLSSLSLGVYNRFNFGRRGNVIGRYLDLGAYGDWNLIKKHYVKDKIDGQVYKLSVTRLKYVENFGYGVFANLGFNRLVLTFKYRLSDLFKESYNYPELTPYTVGVQVNLY